MMNNRIYNYLNDLYPKARCELNYNKDYELLIAIVLSAQSTDKKVNEVTKILFSKYPSIYKLDKAVTSDIEKIIRPVGTYKRKSIYIKQIAHKIILNNGIIPLDREELIKYPGVGRKTINVFLSEFYNKSCIAVDTHVNRVSKRLGIANKDDDVLVVEKKLMNYFEEDKWSSVHLLLVLFGRYHCKSRNPSCNICRLKDICNYEKKT